MFKKSINFLLILVLMILLIGCNEEEPPKKKAVVTVTSWEILTDTDYVTSVFKYVADIEGPRIAIVGGIHGDEVAGWTAALKLKDMICDLVGMCGEILLIPEANKLADKARTRYKVNNHDLSDLNRSFPLDRYSTAKKDSIMISTAILNEVEQFDADYIIDLHESQNSWETMESGTTTSLGNTLIASNKIVFIKQVIANYNDNYKLEGETNFRREESNQKGSFNYYFTNTYKDKIVFTIETNRARVNGTDTASLDKRVRHQLNILEALFDYAWNRIQEK